MKLAHIGVHDTTGNIGDTVLFQLVRELFDKFIDGIEWTLYPLRGRYNRNVIDELNKQDGIVLGGGGVLLKDTNINNVSGWQWACSLDNMKRINVPIYVFAIGYNRFRGQDDFIPVFGDSLRFLVENSAFFSVRNYGSKRALEKYLPGKLKDKVVFQPCPTAVWNRIHDFPPVKVGKKIAVNLASDRDHLRYNGKLGAITGQIISAARRAGKELVSVRHSPHDFVIDGAEVVNLNGGTMEQTYGFYRETPLTIGTRGHSQMIPFGLGRSISSLITHDKVSWFLEDIEHPEWGMEIGEPFEDWLVGRINSNDTINNDALWEVTCKNMKGLI